jgi:hypothetical protein
MNLKEGLSRIAIYNNGNHKYSSPWQRILKV